MADPDESEFLMRQMKRRAAMSKEEMQYVPPEVRDGFLVSGILVEEAQVVRVMSAKVVPQGGDTSEVEPVIAKESCVAEPSPGSPGSSRLSPSPPDLTQPTTGTTPATVSWVPSRG